MTLNPYSRLDPNEIDKGTSPKEYGENKKRKKIKKMALKMRDEAQLLKYGKFYGTAEVSVEDCCLFGKIIDTDFLFLYSGNTFDELKTNFIEAVKEYKKYCKKNLKLGYITPKKYKEFIKE